LPLAPNGDSSNPNAEAIPDTPGSEDLEVLYECLETLLAKLPASYREVVVARLQGESIEQIAEKVKRSRRTVLRVLAHLQELAASELEGAL
jgi:DNA-directed RNA polymerase specialized sigma24 family protein